MSDDLADDEPGGVGRDRSEQIRKKLEFEDWKRDRAKNLAWAVFVIAALLVATLILFTLLKEHSTTSIPIVIALATFPGVLLIGLMRYFLPRDTTSPEGTGSIQGNLAESGIEAITKIVNSLSR